MKGKIDINSVTKVVTPVGNSAHVMVPKSWIGITVKVIPLNKPDKPNMKEIKNFAKEVSESVGGTYRNLPRGHRK